MPYSAKLNQKMLCILTVAVKIPIITKRTFNACTRQQSLKAICEGVNFLICICHIYFSIFHEHLFSKTPVFLIEQSLFKEHFLSLYEYRNRQNFSLPQQFNKKYGGRKSQNAICTHSFFSDLWRQLLFNPNLGQGGWVQFYSLMVFP